MDLFSQLNENIEPREDLVSLVDRVADFIVSLPEKQQIAIGKIHDSRDYETWERIAKETQTFAFSMNLESTWWTVMDHAKKRIVSDGWNPAWDSGFDYLAASIVSPWRGTRFSAVSVDFMMEPLRSASFTE